MRLIKTMDFLSNQGRVCPLRHSNSPAIARICNAESAKKTRFKVAIVYMDDAEVAANVVWQEYVRS